MRAMKRDTGNGDIVIGIKPFLTGGVPNLGLDDLIIDVDAPGGELDADG